LRAQLLPTLDVQVHRMFKYKCKAGAVGQGSNGILYVVADASGKRIATLCIAMRA
jgi:hypothetical protein